MKKLIPLILLLSFSIQAQVGIIFVKTIFGGVKERWPILKIDGDKCFTNNEKTNINWDKTYPFFVNDNGDLFDAYQEKFGWYNGDDFVLKNGQQVLGGKLTYFTHKEMIYNTNEITGRGCSGQKFWFVLQPDGTYLSQVDKTGKSGLTFELVGLSMNKKVAAALFYRFKMINRDTDPCGFGKDDNRSELLSDADIESKKAIDEKNKEKIDSKISELGIKKTELMSKKFEPNDIEGEVQNNLTIAKISLEIANLKKDDKLISTAKENVVEFEQALAGLKQIWTTKNLDVVTYRNGDKIPQEKDKTKWANLTTGAWCYYKNNSDNGPKYGKLYNWYAVNDPRGLAPEGYHIPTRQEWKILINYLGGDDIANWASTGAKMRSTNGWDNDGNGTNTSGFEGLPGGFRLKDGSFGGIGAGGYWWSSTKFYATDAVPRPLFDDVSIFNFGDRNRNGFSVRCIKD